jgi:DNA-binding transcriptional LysR family regulator
MAIAEMPEFIAGDYLRDGQLETIFSDWHLTKGGLYFVTPSARTRPAKITALSDFFAERLSEPLWYVPGKRGNRRTTSPRSTKK